jgi:hypothetical protein
MDVVFGVLQDDTADMGYDKVLKLSIGLKAWAFALGLFYILVDFRFLGKGMTMTRAQRQAVERDIVATGTPSEQHPLTRREAKPWMNIATGCLLAGIVASSWTLFIKYLI